MGGNLKVWVFKFRGKIFGGNTTVYISSGETNTVYLSKDGLKSAHTIPFNINQAYQTKLEPTIGFGRTLPIKSLKCKNCT